MRLHNRYGKMLLVGKSRLAAQSLHFPPFHGFKTLENKANKIKPNKLFYRFYFMHHCNNIKIQVCHTCNHFFFINLKHEALNKCKYSENLQPNI